MHFCMSLSTQQHHRQLHTIEVLISNLDNEIMTTFGNDLKAITCNKIIHVYIFYEHSTSDAPEINLK
jgi:hypothetical protein